jgi:hypothetical protein
VIDSGRSVVLTAAGRSIEPVTSSGAARPKLAALAKPCASHQALAMTLPHSLDDDRQSSTP